MVNVRYIVDSVEAALPFYERMGFAVDMRPAPGFARLSRGDLFLLLNEPGAGGAGQAADDGSRPAPGGWNRFQIEVEDLDETMRDLREAGCRVRTEIVQGNGGRQAVVEDPAGNPVELLEPRAGR